MAKKNNPQVTPQESGAPTSTQEEKKYQVAARYMLSSHRFINIAVDSNEENAEELFYYSNGMYHPGGKTLIRRELAKIFPQYCNSYFNREVITLVKQNTIVDRSAINPPGFVGVLNGNLFLDEHGKLCGLLPHTPDIYITSQLPVMYKRGMDCPKIKNFLVDIVDVDAAKTIIEFLGYCLYWSNSLEKWLLLYGYGENGKTRLVQLIREFLGDTSVVSKTLQALVENRFATSGLFGKRANIVGDLSSRTIYDTGMIKTLTSSDGISAEKKGKDAFEFVSFAKLIIATNRPPRITKAEQTHAFFRRILWIEFTRQFREGNPKRDPFILEKILTPDELSGLLNAALDGLEKIMRVGFTSTGTPAEIMLRYNAAAGEDEDDVLNDKNIFIHKPEK
jgi:putative DNA primase/helicase